jgi:hypothetical protein
MLRALRHRNYRLFFIGQGTSLIGTWMQSVALPWLVYRLTGSVILLGVVGFTGHILTLVVAPVAGVVAFLCIAAVVVAGVWVGPELLGATAPTAATPIPATPPTVAAPTEMPTAAPSPTEAPATETPAVAPPAETLTVAPPAETPTTEVAPTPTFDAQITISVIPETVRVGELLTLVATVNNVGEATLANLHYQLVGDFRSYFELVDGIGEIRHAGDFPPGATDQVSFVLRATQEGTAALQVYMLADVTSTSSKANLLSEVHTVSITSQ